MDSTSEVQLRAALLDQLGYLLLEIAAMKPLLPRLTEPEVNHTGEGPSVKQCYGAIVDWDCTRVMPALRAFSGQNGVAEVMPSTDWNSLSLRDILDRVSNSRRATLALASALGQGPGSKMKEVYTLLHQTVQHDTAQLQTIAKRLNRGV